eukprot:g6768.t1
MANVVTFMLPEIEIPENHVKDALRSILHTIIVNRSIGPLHMRMMSCEMFGLNYPTTNQPEDKQNVDSAIGRFQTVITRSDNNVVKDCFLLEFYETISESGFLGVGTRTKKLLWEQWKIPLRISVTNQKFYNNNRRQTMSIHQIQQTDRASQGVRRRGGSAPPIPQQQLPVEYNVNNKQLNPGQTVLLERNKILKSEQKVQNGIFYIIDAVNRRVDHLPKRKLTALKDAKTYDYSIKLHSEQVEAKASLKPLMTSLSFRF